MTAPQQLAILLKTGHVLTVDLPASPEASEVMRRAQDYAEAYGRMPMMTSGLELLVDPGEIAAVWLVDAGIRLTYPNGGAA